MLEAWAAHDAATFASFVQTLEGVGTAPTGTILDIGCGPNAPMSVMLHSRGAKVIGIDQQLDYRWGLGFKPSRYFRYLHEAGLFKTVRKAVGELVYDRRYYKALEKELGLPLTETGLDLRQMQVEKLEIDSRSIDVIHSNATWEHIADVPAANRELVRVLKPGGVAYIEIHLFPSLSGGHDLPWIVPGQIDLGGRVPWRHLRDPAWQPPVYLNRHREPDYRRFFDETAHLKVLDWKTEFTEGESLLNDAILQELADFGREELTKRSIIVVAKKIA
jgi:SAM-dependent methyltransferase